MQQYIVMGSVAVAVIYVLIQLFLSTRPSFIWGLILPLGFLALALMGQTGRAPEIFGLEYNATCLSYFSRLGFTGMLVLLGELGLCRIFYALHARSKQRRMERVLAEKKARQQQEAAKKAAADLDLDNDPNHIFK